MRILLTGAAGFIGSAFARKALAHGHEIAGLTRRDPLAQQRAVGREARNLVWFSGSLQDVPWAEIESFRPEACVHCAWSTAPTFTYDSPGHFQYVEWSRNFLDRVVVLGARYVLGLGTCLEYRIGPAPLVEDRTPLDPLGPYAQSKHAMRAWLEENSQLKHFQFCWGRGFYVYGAGEDPTRLCSSLIQSLRHGEPVLLKTPGSVKDYVYMEDVAAALLLLLEKRAVGSFNIGTGVGITVLDLAQTVAAMLNKSGLVQKAQKEIPDPLGFVVADSTKLRSLGWSPEYDLKRGLACVSAALPT